MIDIISVYYFIHGGILSMKAETKKLIVTVINIVIFIGNAIISFIGNGGDVSTAATIGGALLTGTTLV